MNNEQKAKVRPNVSQQIPKLRQFFYLIETVFFFLKIYFFIYSNTLFLPQKKMKLKNKRHLKPTGCMVTKFYIANPPTAYDEDTIFVHKKWSVFYK